jgi:hypothetical protein
MTAREENKPVSTIDRAISDLLLRRGDPPLVKIRVGSLARALCRYANERDNVALRREIERQVDELDPPLDRPT